MAKPVDIPKPSDEEAKQLIEAVGYAYGNEAADSFFDEVMEAARKAQRRRAGQNEQSLTE